MEPGTKVIIDQNPHHGTVAENIVATVDTFKPGEGFAGCDLVYVRYVHPVEGKMYTMPLASHFVRVANPDALFAIAEKHEAEAKRLRNLALDLIAKEVGVE